MFFTFFLSFPLALREAEEEIAAEEKIAKELEGEYDRLQAESKELMKILGVLIYFHDYLASYSHFFAGTKSG